MGGRAAHGARIMRGACVAALLLVACAAGCGSSPAQGEGPGQDSGTPSSGSSGGGSSSGSSADSGGDGSGGTPSSGSDGGSLGPDGAGSSSGSSSGGSSSGSSGGSSSSSGGASPVDSGPVCGACNVNADCTASCHGAAGSLYCCDPPSIAGGSGICFLANTTTCPTFGVGGATDAGASDAQCQAMPSAACQTCCTTLHARGLQTAQNVITGCDCGAAGACRVPCAAEFCAGRATTSGDACDVCISNSTATTGGCFNAFNAGCGADPDCVALFSNTGCLAGCPP